MIPTIFDLSGEVLSSKDILNNPKQNPNVCEEAKRYPAEELSSKGNTI
jgi:hypothetical protein